MRRVKWGRRRRRRLGLGGRLLVVLAALVAVFALVEINMAPVLQNAAELKAHSSALSAMERAVRNTLQAHPEYQDYQELMVMEKDSEGRVAVMIPNTMRLNEIVATTLLDIEAGWQDLQRQHISVPLGALSGSKLLAGFGPTVDLRFSSIGTPSLAIKDEFISAGINQTRHRIWLEIDGEVLIAAPLNQERIAVSTTMLLAESVIIGPIPDTYLNFSLDQGLGLLQ